VEAETDV